LFHVEQCRFSAAEFGDGANSLDIAIPFCVPSPGRFESASPMPCHDPRALSTRKAELPMGKIIAISNQKGGVGKTTTAINLGASLAVAEKHTLLLDFDPQGNATSGCGVTDYKSTSYEMLLGEVALAEAVKPGPVRFLDVMPADRRLSGAEIELVNQLSREHFLAEAIKGDSDLYDFVIIDTPPSLGLLTLNALTAADTVLIPIQCEYYALEGLSQLLSTIQLVQKSLNPKLRIEGVLLTMFDRRLKLSNQVAEEAIDYFGEMVYRATIPRNVRLSEAPSFGKPILLYDVECMGAKSYLELAAEVVARNASASPAAVKDGTTAGKLPNEAQSSAG
jgi:chromosome partitioning protein